MKVKSEREVSQSCPTLSDPKDCSLPGSSIHGIFQARVLEWGAIAFSIEYLRHCIIPSRQLVFKFKKKKTCKDCMYFIGIHFLDKALLKAYLVSLFPQFFLVSSAE